MSNQRYHSRQQFSGGAILLAILLAVVVLTTVGCDNSKDHGTCRRQRASAGFRGKQISEDSLLALMKRRGEQWEKRMRDSLGITRRDSIMRSVTSRILSNPIWKKYQKVRPRMTLREVASLMGKPMFSKREDASKEYAGQCYTETYRWHLNSESDVVMTFFTCDQGNALEERLLQERWVRALASITNNKKPITKNQSPPPSPKP